jgi:glycosyltransferase involved in cell wall biosynthesis
LKNIIPIEYLSMKHKLMRLKFIIRPRKIDPRIIPDAKEIRLFIKVRNESLRLPYLLEYYLKRGVDRIFLVDNNSTDNTVDIALSNDKVHVFRTKEEFKSHWNWIEFLIDKYGGRNWCMVVDTDEILYYPYIDVMSIKDLCDFLDQQEQEALLCFLLDMYSDKLIESSFYKQGSDPLLEFPYFDSVYRIIYNSGRNFRTMNNFTYKSFTGGMRERVFKSSVCLSKIALFKNKPSSYLTPDAHGIDNAKISDIQGVLFHFKYLNDFNSRVFEEAKRGQYWDGAKEYKAYAKVIAQEDNINLYFEGSRKFSGQEQLIGLGLMKTSDELKSFAGKLKKRI